MKKWIAIALALMVVCVMPVMASEGGESGHGSVLFLVVLFSLVIPAKLIGAICMRKGLPDVVGHIIVGVIFSYIASQSEDVRALIHDPWIQQTALIGSVILLFLTGLESSVSSMRKVGVVATKVASLGMAGPLILVTGGVLFLGLLKALDAPFNTALFMGAALTATSVGIPAQIFSQQKVSHHPLAQTVIGAGVADDVGGVTLLSVLQGILVGGTVQLVSILIIIAKAIGFLAVGIGLGQFLSKPIARLISWINDSHGMQFTLVFALTACYAYAAEKSGMAAIIGAYAFGLLLEPARHLVHFSKPHVHRVIEHYLQQKGHDEELEEMLEQLKEGELVYSFKFYKEVFVPLFFVSVGLQVNTPSLMDLSLYPIAAFVIILAFLGKVIAGVAIKGNFWEKLFVGTCMSIRGEVGFIFASMGMTLGVLSETHFSVLIITILATTVLPIPFLKPLMIRANVKSQSQETVAD